MHFYCFSCLLFYFLSASCKLLANMQEVDKTNETINNEIALAYEQIYWFELQL